mgnify:CR=1 FL=1
MFFLYGCLYYLLVLQLLWPFALFFVTCKIGHQEKQILMTENEKLDKIAISVRSHRLLRILLRENPMLDTIMRESKNEIEAQLGVKNWIHSEYSSRKDAFRFQREPVTKLENFEKLSWNDYAIIRILDYIDNAGIEYPDRNLRGEIAVSNPVRLIWLAVIKGTGEIGRAHV